MQFKCVFSPPHANQVFFKSKLTHAHSYHFNSPFLINVVKMETKTAVDIWLVAVSTEKTKKL